MYTAVFLCFNLQDSVRLEVEKSKSYLEGVFGSLITISLINTHSLHELNSSIEDLFKDPPDLVYPCGITASKAMLSADKKRNSDIGIISLFVKNPVENKLIRGINYARNRCVPICSQTLSNLLIVHSCFVLLPRGRRGLVFYYNSFSFMQEEEEKLFQEYKNREDGRELVPFKLFRDSKDLPSDDEIEEQIKKSDFVFIPIIGFFDNVLKSKISHFCTKHHVLFIDFTCGISGPESSFQSHSAEGQEEDHLKMAAIVTRAMLIDGKKAGELGAVMMNAITYFSIDAKKAEAAGALFFPEILEYLSLLSQWGYLQGNTSQVFYHADHYLKGEAERNESIQFFIQENDRLREKVKEGKKERLAKINKKMAYFESLHKPQSIKVGIIFSGEGPAHDLLRSEFKKSFLELCGDEYSSVDFLEAHIGDKSEYPEVFRDIAEEQCSALFSIGFKSSRAVKKYGKRHGLRLPTVGGGINRYSAHRVTTRTSSPDDSFVGIFFDNPVHLTLAEEAFFHIEDGGANILFVGMKDYFSPATRHETDRLITAFKKRYPDATVDLHLVETESDAAYLHDVLVPYDIAVIPEGAMSTNAASSVYNIAERQNIEVYGAPCGKRVIRSDWGVRVDYELCGKMAATILFNRIVKGVPLSEHTSLMLSSSKSYSGNRKNTTRPSGVAQNDYFLLLENSIRLADEEGD